MASNVANTQGEGGFRDGEPVDDAGCAHVRHLQHRHHRGDDGREAGGGRGALAAEHLLRGIVAVPAGIHSRSTWSWPDRIGKRGVLGGSILLFEASLYTFMGGLYLARPWLW